MRRSSTPHPWTGDSLSGREDDGLSETCDSRGFFTHLGRSGRLSSRGFLKKYSRTGKYNALFAMGGQRR